MARRLTPQLALLLVLLFAVLTGMVVSNQYLQGRLGNVHARAERVVANIERIRYYDEALTGAARLAAATGDERYERRYRALAPRLRRLIAETVKLVDSRAAERAIAQTADANTILVAMEERSFELLREGRNGSGTAVASALLQSRAYSYQKQVYREGLDRAAAVFRETVDRNTAHVERYRPVTLAAGIVSGAALLLAGVLVLRLARERERLAAAEERRTREEARRRAAELDYFETQQHFSQVLQATRHEPEAHDLIKRHLERTIPDARVAVLQRNVADRKLDVMTPLADGSPLAAKLAGAEPEACAAIRLGRPHFRHTDQPPLLRCAVCGDLPGGSLCAPSLVGGEVIGSVLVEHGQALEERELRRVHETVAQVAPMLANLRNLSLAETRAVTDALTGLPNRRLIDDTIKRMAAHAGRSLSPLAAIMLDLDHFKAVNDRFGHDRGDEVLAGVGAAIAACMRESDFAGRYGGEEFLVLLPDTPRDGARHAAERLRTEIAGVRVPGTDYSLTASLGVAILPDDAGDCATLLRCADRALYAAKRAGRNRVEFAESSATVETHVDDSRAARSRPH